MVIKPKGKMRELFVPFYKFTFVYEVAAGQSPFDLFSPVPFGTPAILAKQLFCFLIIMKSALGNLNLILNNPVYQSVFFINSP